MVGCTGDHGDVSQFIEGIEAEDGLEVDAAVSDANLVEFFYGFLNSKDDIA